MEWEVVFLDEVEGRHVRVEMRRVSEDDQDSTPRVRLTISNRTPDSEAEEIRDVQLAEQRGSGDDPVTLEFEVLDDLDEELMERGFSPEAANGIVVSIPISPKA